MSELFAALFLLVFVLALIYVVKKLLDSDKRNSEYKKFIVLPIRNNMTDIAKMIKAAYWDCDFNDESVSEILIYPTEKPDEKCTQRLNEVCEDFDSVKIIKHNELENYIKSRI